MADEARSPGPRQKTLTRALLSSMGNSYGPYRAVSSFAVPSYQFQSAPNVTPEWTRIFAVPAALFVFGRECRSSNSARQC